MHSQGGRRRASSTDADAARSLQTSTISPTSATRPCSPREKRNERPQPHQAEESSRSPESRPATRPVHGSRSGNDLHYRGYDILDFADEASSRSRLLCWFTRNADRLGAPAYKAKLKGLRGLPAAVKSALEAVPASAHPMT